MPPKAEHYQVAVLPHVLIRSFGLQMLLSRVGAQAGPFGNPQLGRGGLLCRSPARQHMNRACEQYRLCCPAGHADRSRLVRRSADSRELSAPPPRADIQCGGKSAGSGRPKGRGAHAGEGACRRLCLAGSGAGRDAHPQAEAAMVRAHSTIRGDVFLRATWSRLTPLRTWGSRWRRRGRSRPGAAGKRMEFAAQVGGGGRRGRAAYRVRGLARIMDPSP